MILLLIVALLFLWIFGVIAAIGNWIHFLLGIIVIILVVQALRKKNV